MVKKQTSKKPEKNHHKKEPDYISFTRYSGLAFQTGIVIALFTWGGYELDEWLGMSFPVFLSIGLFVGLAAGVYLSIKDFIKKK